MGNGLIRAFIIREGTPFYGSLLVAVVVIQYPVYEVMKGTRRAGDVVYAGGFEA
jgi:hypothetical protein